MAWWCEVDTDFFCFLLSDRCREGLSTLQSAPLQNSSCLLSQGKKRKKESDGEHFYFGITTLMLQMSPFVDDWMATSIFSLLLTLPKVAHKCWAQLSTTQHCRHDFNIYTYTTIVMCISFLEMKNINIRYILKWLGDESLIFCLPFFGRIIYYSLSLNKYSSISLKIRGKTHWLRFFFGGRTTNKHFILRNFYLFFIRLFIFIFFKIYTSCVHLFFRVV